jgi:hypothetical protein
MEIHTQLGPLFTVEANDREAFTLEVGAKTSSLFGSGGGGSATGTLDVTLTSATSLGAFRAVTYDGQYCEPNVDSLSKYAGVTRVAVGPGESLNVVRSGILTEGGWSWTPNVPIYVGSTGNLTQTATTPLRRIGLAISATQIALDPLPIIGV